MLFTIGSLIYLIVLVSSGRVNTMANDAAGWVDKKIAAHEAEQAISGRASYAKVSHFHSHTQCLADDYQRDEPLLMTPVSSTANPLSTTPVSSTAEPEPVYTLTTVLPSDQGAAHGASLAKCNVPDNLFTGDHFSCHWVHDANGNLVKCNCETGAGTILKTSGALLALVAVVGVALTL